MQQTFFENDLPRPLADRLRPKNLDEFFGQQHLIGRGKLLRRLIESDQISSMIFWGPPGVGKTTLAGIIASSTKSEFINFSAVTSGIKEIRGVMTQAEENRRRKEEQLRLAAECKAKGTATEIRIEAKVQQGKVERISDADGFKERKEPLADVFNRADAFYDENVKRWDDAYALYKSYVEQSKVLIALDEQRRRAVAKKGEVKVSFEKAEQAGAKTYARDNWNAAVKTWNAADSEFRRMEFAPAAEMFAKALKEFDGCAEEAKDRRLIAEKKQAEEKRRVEERKAEERRNAELARQKEELHRQEERRKSMRSLPGKWVCKTTLNQDGGHGNISCSPKYELVVQNDGRWTEKQIADSSVTTWNGQWSLAGNVLTLKYDEKAVTVSYVQSKRYVIIHWRNDGSFELRHDLDDLREQCPDAVLSYDANGTFVSRAKWRMLFFSGESMRSETAKIFRRVSN